MAPAPACSRLRGAHCRWHCTVRQAMARELAAFPCPPEWVRPRRRFFWAWPSTNWAWPCCSFPPHSRWPRSLRSLGSNCRITRRHELSPQCVAETREVKINIAQTQVDHGQSLEVMADDHFVDHTHGTVQLNRLLSHQARGLTDIRLGTRYRTAALRRVFRIRVHRGDDGHRARLLGGDEHIHNPV